MKLMPPTVGAAVWVIIRKEVNACRFPAKTGDRALLNGDATTNRRKLAADLLQIALRLIIATRLGCGPQSGRGSGCDPREVLPASPLRLAVFALRL